MANFDPKSLSLTGKKVTYKKTATVKKAKPNRTELFIKGPIPLPWLSKVSQLPGKTLEVGIVLWFYAGLKRSSTVKLSNAVLQEFGVDRHAKYRALKQMKSANLISTIQSTGQSPVITILDSEKVDEAKT